MVDPAERRRVPSGVHVSEVLLAALNFAMHFLVDGFHISIAFFVAMAGSSPDGEYRTQ